jgi:hypothetical protein
MATDTAVIIFMAFGLLEKTQEHTANDTTDSAAIASTRLSAVCDIFTTLGDNFPCPNKVEDCDERLDISEDERIGSVIAKGALSLGGGVNNGQYSREICMPPMGNPGMGFSNASRLRCLWLSARIFIGHGIPKNWFPGIKIGVIGNSIENEILRN